MYKSLYQTEEEIEQLTLAFLNKSLDKNQWTHAAHLTVGIWHLKKYDLHEATCRIKSGIIAYNLAVGGENTGTGGYHESMTLFWTDVLHIFVAARDGFSLKDTCNEFLGSRLAGKDLPFIFYSKEKLLSPLARARAVAPDIRQITPDAVLNMVQEEYKTPGRGA